ncbi:MAG: 50S ribosomal protein L30 [Candidatus Marinimicrobia bacterium]|nr:50S ribosomal protein L30 [Candidatus Neomarinimicrobiota bacterium]MCH8288157.1 50S ribosomal protein L30 [Candidatus Neomarinimicrobiota bacterium]
MTAKETTKKIKITQVKSAIGYHHKAKKTLKALGLRKMHQSVLHNDNEAIRGMVRKIDYLIKVEEV